MSETTLYDVLGLAPSAPEDVVKAAYKARVKQLHPDRGGDPAEMAAVNDAYATLSNAQKREEYDRELRAARTSHTATAGGSERDNSGATRNEVDDDVFDEQVWAEAEWWDGDPTDTGPAPAEPGTPTGGAPDGSARQDFGLVSLIGLLSAMALWTLTLIAVGTVIIGGLIDNTPWSRIGLNLLLVAIVTILNLAVVNSRSEQPRLRPSLRYVAYVLVLLLFGVSSLNTDPLLGSAVLLWAGLLVIGAEAMRLEEKRKSWAA